MIFFKLVSRHLLIFKVNELQRAIFLTPKKMGGGLVAIEHCHE